MNFKWEWANEKYEKYFSWFFLFFVILSWVCLLHSQKSMGTNNLLSEYVCLLHLHCTLLVYVHAIKQSCQCINFLVWIFTVSNVLEYFAWWKHSWQYEAWNNYVSLANWTIRNNKYTWCLADFQKIYENLWSISIENLEIWGRLLRKSGNSWVTSIES